MWGTTGIITGHTLNTNLPCREQQSRRNLPLEHMLDDDDQQGSGQRNGEQAHEASAPDFYNWRPDLPRASRLIRLSPSLIPTFIVVSSLRSFLLPARYRAVGILTTGEAQSVVRPFES